MSFPPAVKNNAVGLCLPARVVGLLYSYAEALQMCGSPTGGFHCNWSLHFGRGSRPSPLLFSTHFLENF